MSLEKRLEAIPAQSFTADGTVDGLITVADATEYKVKQLVFLSASSLPDLDQIEIKRVISATQMYVGPKGGSIDSRTDISAYTVVLGAAVTANEQLRPSIPNESINRAVYEEEPTVALRSILVDELGNDYDALNPFPVAAVFDGTVQVGDIRITAHNNAPVFGDIHSSVRIGDGTNELTINPDGSISVHVIPDPNAPGLNIIHNEITSVASGVEATLITIVAPPAGYRFQKIEVSGDNVAIFRVKLNGATIFDKRTWWCNFNETFSFEDFAAGLLLTSGQTLTVTVLHNRPYVGSFEVTAMYI